VATSQELREIPLFDGLDERELTELAPWFEERSVSTGTRLTGEGAMLGPGDFFGEVAILGDGRRSATVTTTEPSTVLTMFGTDFRRLQAAQPAIAESILRTMQARVGLDVQGEAERV
jgi:hypothetical protein